MGGKYQVFWIKVHTVGAHAEFLDIRVPKMEVAFAASFLNVFFDVIIEFSPLFYA